MTAAGSAAPAPPTETVGTCDLCRSPDAAELLSVHDRVHGLPGEFTLVRCDRCGLIRLSPRPAVEHLGFYYPSEDYSPYLAPDAAGRGRLAYRLRDALRAAALRASGYPGHEGRGTAAGAAVLRHLPAARRFGTYRSAGFPSWRPGGRALEVGPGNGSFLATLAANGWTVAGLDLSPAAAEAAQRLYGLEVLVGALGDDPFAPGSFDFVHLRHVIEHVPSPRAALQRVRELLAPGGRVYLETPNAGGTGLARYGEHWFPIEAPRHLWLFDPATLARLAGECGLRVLATQTSTYLTPQWAAAFREQDRTGARTAPAPVVPAADRWRVQRERLADRAALLADRDRGDILGLWAEPA